MERYAPRLCHTLAQDATRLQATPAAYPALQRSITGFASAARTMVEALSDIEQNTLTSLLRRAIKALVGQQALSAWSRTEAA